MSADPARVLPRPAPPKPRHAWAAAPDIAWLALAIVTLAALHLATLQAMAGLWWRSQTFAHGIAILPISAWLVWRQRDRLAAVPRQPWPPALLALGALGACWLLAAVANVQVLQQYCVVAMTGAAVASVLGLRFTRALAFPLAYLLLAVPFGEIFVPPLIEFTSGFTVAALQLAGIPVFRENNYLSLPSGNWSVVEACSGLRYVIASLALGALYAHLTYRSLLRRAVFMLVSVSVPVLANGLRAFTIVLIGHWSNMRLAVGIDHLIYGWVFFGLVSLLLFWCGAAWQEQPGTATAPPVQSTPAAPSAPQAGARAGMRMALAVIAVSAIWPLLAIRALRAPPADMPAQARLALAPPPAPWRVGPLRPADFQVPHAGRPEHAAGLYSDGQASVSLQLTWYRHQQKGAELLTPAHRSVVAGLPQWNEIADSTRRVTAGGRSIVVRKTVVQAAGIKLLVWRWYRQAGSDTASPQLLKLLLAKSKLFGGPDSGAEIVLAAAYDEQAEQAAAAMQRLLEAMLPAIDQGLHDVAAR